MRNPLNRRVFKRLGENAKIYLALFVMLTLMIGFISGLMVANGSMERAAHNAFTDYNIEDGHFELEDEIGDLRSKIEDTGITLYDQYYKDLSEDVGNDGTQDAVIRVFAVRDKVNRASLLDGAMPSGAGEIAIDRMHADNVGIKTGDTITIGGSAFRVTGLIASSDYSTLYKSNTDTMFDAITFNIGFVTQEQFDALDGKVIWQYAYKLGEEPEENEKDAAEKLAEKIAVLSATGGITSDKDEAKELADIADEADVLKDKADDLQARADALEAEGDDLQTRADALEAEGDKLKERGEPLEAEGEALRERGAALEKEGAELQAQKAALEARGAALQKKGEEISALAVTDPAAAAVQAAALQAESDELAAEGEELAKKADDLQARADALKAEGDDLQTRADALQAEVSALEERGNALKEEGDRLEERGDALKEEGDGLEAQGDALEERLKALGVEDTDELDDLVTNKMTDFVPEFANQAIHFATDDFGSDKTMSEYFLIIFVIILAFIFGITAKNDVRKDAAVIGTLRASGYTRGELIFHYAASPVLVTLLAAIAGNILGYTVFKYIVVNMYYGSYSLPAYVTVYDPQAFVKTSVVPVIIMSAVTVLMIAWKMRLSPLKFMRHDLSTSKRRKAVRLPKWSFLDRFRTRIFLRSIGDYIVMFVGLFFVMVMLCFCLGMPSTLDNFIRNSDQMVIADYQTVLTSDEDENEIVPTNGEKFMMIELESVSKLKDGEQITVYGFSPDSKYLNEGELTGTQVSVSAAYAEKFRLNAGDTIELKEKYSTDIFKFDVARISGRQGSLAVYMPIDAFEDTFDDGVVGYFSDTPLEGVDEEYIAKVITEEDISAMANQLNHSIGGYMKYFAAVCLIIAAAVLYLLTKQIIEKNTVSISMAKVLGYYNKEINSIYIRTTTICVIVMTLISVAAGGKMVDVIWRAIMMDMSGWFTYEVFFKDVVTAVTGTILVYLLIAFADMRRIKRIPMAEALKNAE